MKCFNSLFKDNILYSSALKLLTKPIIIHNFLHYPDTAGKENIFTRFVLFLNWRSNHFTNLSLKYKVIIKEYFYFFNSNHRMYSVANVIPKSNKRKTKFLWKCELYRHLYFFWAFPLRRRNVNPLLMRKYLKKYCTLRSIRLLDLDRAYFDSFFSEKLNFVKTDKLSISPIRLNNNFHSTTFGQFRDRNREIGSRFFFVSNLIFSSN